jgi:hypothetical protein
MLQRNLKYEAGVPTSSQRHSDLSEIWDPHGADYEHWRLLRYDAVSDVGSYLQTMVSHTKN